MTCQPTTGQANGTPNAIRFAYGQLTYNVPEYSWVKVRVNNTTAILDDTGCPSGPSIPSAVTQAATAAARTTSGATTTPTA